MLFCCSFIKHLCCCTAGVFCGSPQEAGPLIPCLTDSYVPVVGLWRKPSDRSAQCSRGELAKDTLAPQQPGLWFSTMLTIEQASSSNNNKNTIIFAKVNILSVTETVVYN